MTAHRNSGETKRRFPRVMAPVFFRSPKLFSRKRRVSDISPAGVRIFSDEHLQVDTRLEIELFLPDGFSLQALVRIVWINPLPPGSDANYDVGLEFIDLSPSVAMEKLKSVLQYAE